MSDCNIEKIWVLEHMELVSRFLGVLKERGHRKLKDSNRDKVCESLISDESRVVQYSGTKKYHRTTDLKWLCNR